MNGYNLTDRQKELLRRLVRCVREEGSEEPISASYTFSQRCIQFFDGTTLEYQGDLFGDLDALCDAGLMGARYSQKGTKLYSIRQAGYDAVDNDFGAPLILESPALAQPAKGQPETLPMAQIFLSYAREDEEKVRQLYQKLSDAGFKPWMDTKDIMPGENWKLAIQEAIRGSDFVLICLSANSTNKRGFIQKEIKYALDTCQEKLETDIFLIPVRLEGVEVPRSLRDFHWLDLFEENGWKRLVETLQEGMKRQAIVEAEQSKTDFIKWNNAGNLFWASHDLMLTIDRLSHNAHKEAIFFTLQQSLHHVRALGFKGPPIESRLTELTAEAAEDLKIPGVSWPSDKLRYYRDELEPLKDALGDLASESQPGFDRGPKTSKPVILEPTSKEIIHARNAGIAAAAFEVFAEKDYAWDTLGITIKQQTDSIPDLITYDVFTDDIDPASNLIVGQSKQLSIRFQTLPDDQVEIRVVKEHRPNVYSELTPRQLQELVRDFPEKFVDYYQATVPKPVEQIYTKEEIEEETEHIKALLNIRRRNLHLLEARAARQSMSVDIKTHNEIDYEKREIAQLEARLKSLGSEYKLSQSLSTS